MTNDAATFLDHDSVRFSDAGVAEIDVNHPTIFIPRDQVRNIELLYGSGAERPLVMIFFAIVLIGIAAFSVAWLVLAYLRHGVFHATAITAVAFVIPAVWFLDLAFRKRWYLLVHTPRGTRKLLFKTSKDEAALRSFLSTARGRFGF